MNPAASASPAASGRPRVLALLAGAAVVALLLHGPIVQWDSYHHFADARSWGGIPNAANVLSNLPFAWVGAWGIRRLAGRADFLPWSLFSWAVLLTALGSTLYHWAPGSASLVGDRLPIAWACATLTCAFLAERVDARWRAPRAIGAAVAMGTWAVAWWWVGDACGQGDLRPYAFVQFMPMLLVPAALMLKMPSRSTPALPASTWWTALALYAFAKATEFADETVLQSLGVVSGHTLKHLLAAGAAAWLLIAALRQAGAVPQNR